LLHPRLYVPLLSVLLAVSFAETLYSLGQVAFEPAAHRLLAATHYLGDLRRRQVSLGGEKKPSGRESSAARCGWSGTVLPMGPLPQPRQRCPDGGGQSACHSSCCSAGTAPIRRITPSCSGHYPGGRKKVSLSIAQDFRKLAKELTYVLFRHMRISELAKRSCSPI
jgi:hypothetical protein